MHYLFALLFWLPATCLAFGADTQEFVAISPDGNKLVTMPFLLSPEDWTGNNWIYGSKSAPKFRYCWTNFTQTDPSTSTHVVCTSKMGGKPSIWYKHGHYSGKSGIRYQEAMAEFDRIRKAGYKRGIKLLDEYHVCDKGCSATTPTFILRRTRNQTTIYLYNVHV